MQCSEVVHQAQALLCRFAKAFTLWNRSGGAVAFALS